MVIEILVICEVVSMENNGISTQLTLVPENASSYSQKLVVSISNASARLINIGQKYPITIKPV